MPLSCCSKMEAFLLRGLLLMWCFLLVESLVCHHCSGVSHPVHCTKTTACNGSEVCFTERILSDNREMFHNSGCATKQVCTEAEKKGLPCNGLRECVSFCDSDRCNKMSCVDSGYGQKKSCKEYKEAGLPSGVYSLDLRDGLPPLQVYCDMDTAGGGWTVFQRRKDGSVNFYRDWEDYRQGFGDLRGEFWLGNDHLHRLTKAGLTTLRVDVGDFSGSTAYALYSSFRVGPASDYYRLSVSGYSGNAGDSLAHNNGMVFSTKDADRDSYGSNCAELYTGAWWYGACSHSNLNGGYYAGGQSDSRGVFWYFWKGIYYSLKSSEMKLREP